MTTPAAVSPRQPGLFRRALRHRKGFLIAWLFGLGLAWSWIYLDVKPVYRAASLLRVDPVISDLYGVRGTGEQHDTFLGTQAQLITSPSVLSVAKINPAVAALPRIRAVLDPEQELRKVVSVGGVPGTYLLEVSMTSSDPHEAAVIVNAVVDAFLDANENWSDGKTKAQIKNLENYKHDLEVQTKETEDRWKELVKRGDPDSLVLKDLKEVQAPLGAKLAGRAGVTIEEYKRFRQELFQVNLELAEAVAWLDEVRRTAKDVPQTFAQVKIDQQVMDRFKAEPVVVHLAAKRREAEKKLEEAGKGGSKPDESTEQAARNQLQELTSIYNQTWESLSKIYREQLEEAPRPDPDHELREADRRVRFLNVRQAALLQLAKHFDVPDRRQATDQVELALTLDERSTLKSMLEAVRRRLEQLKFEAKGVNRVQRIDPAKVPGKPIADNRVAWLAIAPFAMLFVAFVPFLLLEAWNGPPGQPTDAGNSPVEA